MDKFGAETAVEQKDSLNLAAPGAGQQAGTWEMFSVS